MRGVSRNSISFALMLGVCALALCCAGCSFVSSCNEDPSTETISDGIVHGNTYISAPNDGPVDGVTRGPWAHFPPNRTLVFEHKLPAIPYQVAIWLAFQKFGTLATAAGNSAIWQVVSDEKTITIKNDTCSDFYVWVEASIPVYSETNGAAGTSGADSIEAAGAAGAP